MDHAQARQTLREHKPAPWWLKAWLLRRARWCKRCNQLWECQSVREAMRVVNDADPHSLPTEIRNEWNTER